MPLQVAFDISELGLGHSVPQHRRGINRVVEEVCRVLMTLAREGRNDLEMMLTSVESSVRAAAYLAAEEQEPLASAPLLSRASHRRWTAVEEWSRVFVEDIAARAIVWRASRWAVSRSMAWQRQIALRLPSFDPEKVDVFHSPALTPIPRYVLRARRPVCFLTLYDLIPVRYPHLVASRSLVDLNYSLVGFGPEHFAICISQHVKDDVCDYLKLDPSHVFVAPLAADASRFHPCADTDQIASVRRRCHLPDDVPYLLTLCAVEPRKNLLHLIRCFARLRREDPAARDLHLVLVGYAQKFSRPALDALIAAEKLEDFVVLTGYLDDHDLAPLYSGSLAFVFPSLAEGFGLPPLEAMQCGVPVICSDRTSLPEVMGDAGLLIDPEDADALCAAMRRILHDEPLRADLSCRGLARAAHFSWARCAADHLAAYRAALQLKHG